MKLKKTVGGVYTLKGTDKTGRETRDAGYKFVRLKSVNSGKSRL